MYKKSPLFFTSQVYTFFFQPLETEGWQRRGFKFKIWPASLRHRNRVFNQVRLQMVVTQVPGRAGLIHWGITGVGFYVIPCRNFREEIIPKVINVSRKSRPNGDTALPGSRVYVIFVCTLRFDKSAFWCSLEVYSLSRLSAGNYQLISKRFQRWRAPTKFRLCWRVVFELFREFFRGKLLGRLPLFVVRTPRNNSRHYVKF